MSTEDNTYMFVFTVCIIGTIFCATKNDVANQ